MAELDVAAGVEALEAYLQRRGWSLDQALPRARIYANPEAEHRLLVADADTEDAAYHLDRALDLLARWEARPRALVEKDVLGSGRLGRLEMYFDGGPVAGGQTEVGFASKVLADARKLVAAVHRYKTQGNLASTGTLTTPQRIMLASTPPGSFGFELVEEQDDAQPGLPLGSRTTLGEAMDEVVGLLDGARREDELATLLVEQEPRVVRNLDALLEHVKGAGASMRLVAPARRAAFTALEVEQVRERLAEAERSVHEVDHEGTLEGLLPHGRAFEFTALAELRDGRSAVLDAPDLIRGAVARTVPEDQVRAWAARVQTTVRARFHEVRTARPGREPTLARALLAVWGPEESPPPVLSETPEED